MAHEQLPAVVRNEIACFKADRVLTVTCLTELGGQAKPTDRWIAPAAWLVPPKALRVLCFSTAELIFKAFALCSAAQFHMRHSGADRADALLVCAIAEA
ncbi:MAG: hypothetical protein ABI903_18260 [Actinomycetota bacterium]